MSIQSIARWVVLIPLFAIPFIPLYIANDLFFPFITGKGFAFRILVEIALAGYVLLALVDTKYRPRFSWTLVLYGALALWMFIADSLATNSHKAFWSNFERMDGYVTLIHVFVFFVILGSVLTVDKLWRRWWMFFLSGSALVVAYSLFQLAGMADIHQGGARVDATIGNAAYLAVYMLFTTAVSLWQAFESKGALRYTLTGFAALSAFILFSTETRGAVLGLFGAIALGSVLWMIEAGKKQARLIAGGLFLGLILCVGAFFALKSTPFVQSNPTLARISSISFEDGKTRFALWDMALDGVAERPVFGWGQEGFNYVFQKYYRPSLYAQEPWFDRAHNTYIDWLIAGGVPALLLFLGLLGSAVLAFYRKTVSRPERIFLISALAAYAFQAIFVFDNLVSYIPLAALLAVAHSLHHRPFGFLECAQEVKATVAHSVVAPLAAALLIGLLWVVNVPSIAQANAVVVALNSDRSTGDVTSTKKAYTLFTQASKEPGFGTQEVAEQFVTYAGSVVGRTVVPTELRTEITATALSAMQREVEKTPHDARLRIQYAVGLRVAGDFQKSLEQSALALLESPKKQTILLERGFEFWESGDIATARDLFNALYALDTSFTDLAGFAAAGEIANGDLAAGDAILLKAYGTTDVQSEALIVGYYQAKQYERLYKALRLRTKEVPETASYLRLASAYVVTGRYADARTVAQEALAAYPADAKTITAFMAKIPQ